MPLALTALALSFIISPGVQAAEAPVDLGVAGGFAVLAGAGITNTGPTTIVGDLGSFATTSETGLASVTLQGSDHGGDAVTQQAKADLTTAFGIAAGRGPATSVPTELGGLTLTPGVYRGATLAITGTLVLDTLGDPAAVFIFQTNSTLITGSGSNMSVLGGGTACNVYWQVGSSATLGTGSHLIGSVLAEASITATTSATIDGRLLAQTGAVTLDSNTITAQTCPQGSVTTTVASPATTVASSGVLILTPPTSPVTTVPAGGATPGGTTPGVTTTVAGATGNGTVPGSPSLPTSSAQPTGPSSAPTIAETTNTTLVVNTAGSMPGQITPLPVGTIPHAPEVPNVPAAGTPSLAFTGMRVPLMLGVALLLLGVGLLLRSAADPRQGSLQRRMGRGTYR